MAYKPKEIWIIVDKDELISKIIWINFSLNKKVFLDFSLKLSNLNKN